MSDERGLVEPGIGRAVGWLARQVELVLAQQGLTLAQYRFLAVLTDRPAGASVLARDLGVSKPSVTAVADGLVNRGLVDRVGDARDRRRITHALTEPGRATVRTADEAIETGLGAVIDHLDTSGGHHMAAGFNALNDLARRIAAWEPEDEP